MKFAEREVYFLFFTLGASADGGGDIDQISKRGKGPPSPQVPADIEVCLGNLEIRSVR